MSASIANLNYKFFRIPSYNYCGILSTDEKIITAYVTQIWYEKTNDDKTLHIIGNIYHNNKLIYKNMFLDNYYIYDTNRKYSATDVIKLKSSFVGIE